MKRQVDKTGGKLWFNENLIDGFQDQLYKAIESHYKPYGSCIVSGCEVSGSNIAEGIVYLDGKIMPFAGVSGVTFPKYLKSRMTPVTAAYDDGHSDTTEEIYEAILSSTIPAGEYIIISAQGGKSFRQAFQDANNRMVSDAKINEWNASRGNAVSDVRDGVESRLDTLKKHYNSGMFYKGVILESDLDSVGAPGIYRVNYSEYNRQLVVTDGSGSAAIVQTEYHYLGSVRMRIAVDGDLNKWTDWLNFAATDFVEEAKNSAISTAVNDLRGGIGTAHNTLKKIYTWAVSLFDTKIDKSVMSSNISSTSTANVATSKAVNDAKQNAIATAKSEALSDIRDGVGSSWNSLKKIYEFFKNYYHAGNANRSDVDWKAKNITSNGINKVYGEFQSTANPTAESLEYYAVLKSMHSANSGYLAFRGGGGAGKVIGSNAYGEKTDLYANDTVVANLTTTRATFNTEVAVEDLIIK